MKKTLRFGIIGGGLMGKEFASAAARWCHLTGDLPTPEIVGVCSLLQQDLDWFSSHFSTVKYLTKDYQDLLEKKEIDVIIQKDGKAVPIEVKSGNTRANSLKSIMKNNKDISYGYKFIDGNIGTSEEGIITLPLYMIAFFDKVSE